MPVFRVRGVAFKVEKADAPVIAVNEHVIPRKMGDGIEDGSCEDREAGHAGFQ